MNDIWDKSMLYFIHILHVRSAARGLRKNAEIPDVTNICPESLIRMQMIVVQDTKAHLRQRGALVGDIRCIIVLRVETSLSTK